MLTASELWSMVTGAPQDLASWSRFVALTEFAWQDQALVSDAAEWQVLWFEMEIVNALALAEWEEAGSPRDWLLQWNARYQSDAQTLASSLRRLIVRLGGV
ncbi:hypothetical protein [Pseudomonas sp. NPDC008258]|uniref:hypothetical protein n=1 Tax=Pseudomonas sp. NPDC008258 TaxID=3364418 RepID=UPI0036EF20D8